MAQIQGYAAHAAGAELLPYHYDPGNLGPFEVEVAIDFCGICHSDLHLIQNDWGMSQYPFIPGHEIIGKVTAIGTQVRNLQKGQRVGIGWQSNSCGICEWCKLGMENLCAQSEATCVHRNGGYADRIRCNSRFAIAIPEVLESENAAPLLCAGITVYNPLRTHGINPASRIGVVGIGGLGHLAIQFARAFGAEVTAFSSSLGKEEEARALGAHKFVNNRETKAMKEVQGKFDFIINTANADQDWNHYLAALRPTGKLCFVGVPPSPISLPAFPLISGMRSVCGSTIGSPRQIVEMLDIAARHNVKAQTELFPISKVNDALEKVKKNKVRYRAVLSI